MRRHSRWARAPTVRGLLLAVFAAAAGLVLPAVAAGHSQLVSSTPGSGELVATAPSEARLVFSEPAEPGYTSADLLDGQGRVLAERLGTLDPTDARELIVPLPPLTDGAYSLAWRAVSAADGHATSGFVTFAIGTTPLPPGVGGYDPGSSGDIHAGHSGTTAFAETQGRATSYLGWMLAIGLALLGLVVLRPAVGSVPVGLVLTQAAALLAGGLGSGLLALSSSEAFTSSTDAPASGSAVDTLGYLMSSRTGVLLLTRTVLGVAAAVAVFLAARSRPRLGLWLALVASGLGIALTVAGSHAAAFTAIAPVVAQGLHMAAAGVWLGGVVALAGGLASGGLKRADLPAIVPRFSALAIVSVGLLSVTGIYAMWLETGQILSLDSGYTTVLDVKILLFLGAIGIGALNYLERPRSLVARLPFGRRVSVEAVLGVCVVIATALLASGSPPAGVRPIQIAPAAADAVPANGPVAGATFGIEPARPGPNRYTVTLQGDIPATATVELRLRRLDADQGISTLALTRIEGSGIMYGAPGGLLPANSSWDATVAVRDSSNLTLGNSQRRFTFALDDSGISEGRALPLLDPALALALLLLALGVLALAYAVGGGRLPRTDAVASRVSLLAGGAAAVVVGIVMTFAGPHP